MWVKLFRIVIYTSLVFLISGFFSAGSAWVDFRELKPDSVKLDPPFIREENVWIDTTLASLTIEQKIAQLMMVAIYPRNGEAHFNEIERLVRSYGIGGLILFQGDPKQEVFLVNRMQKASKVPLLISIDGEWGLSMRITNTLKYPRQMMLGAVQDNKLIYQMGEDIGEQCRRMGININYAPVVDINNNPMNPVIGSRSFGEDRDEVAAKGMAYMLGMQSKGVMATAKHFPGHGDTDKDSHQTLPVINHDMKRLDSLELYPFKELINMGLGGIMVAHLQIPAIDTTPGQATTLSKPCINDLLKDSLGFNGLVITDALSMRGVSDYYTQAEIAAKALVAGNDILLMPENVPEAINAIKIEIEKGSITEQEITNRCKKVLQLKSWAKLEQHKVVSTDSLWYDLHKPEYELIRRKLIASSLTLLENKKEIIPFVRLDTLKIASVIIDDGKINQFQKSIDLYADVTHFTISKEATESEFNALIGRLAKYNMIIVGLHNTNMHAHKHFGITNPSVKFIDSLCNTKQVVVDIFASPYSVGHFKNIEKSRALIVSYEDNSTTQEISAQLLFGGIMAKGKLLVTASDKYPLGTGLSTKKKIRLAYGLPEEVGIPSSTLLAIDSLIEDAIKSCATPGCQVLAAKDGIVFYQKSFGYQTYYKKRPVENTDIYDIASITKIAATTPLIMKLYEEGKIDINDKLSKYLPMLDSSNKSEIVIKEILTHNAQLISWIPFYVFTLEGFYIDEGAFSKNYSDTFPIRLGKDFYMNKHVKYKDGCYSYKYSEEYPYQITEKMYMNKSYRDTIFDRIVRSGLRTRNGYKYSDVGFYLFYKMIEDITQTKLDKYVRDSFYIPLGAYTLGYKPLERFDLDRIAPTEDDIVFRKQLVHGYVHDPGAAMLGGVCGHAGVFSSANDLAKLMQMYLQGGEYGGIRYFKQSTLNLFTSCPHCDEDNRRGLGFDKPQMNEDIPGPTCKCLSEKSFGHTGFTGTYAWADPETNTVYIFLSNRCYPDAENNLLLEMDVRTNIQKVIIEAAKAAKVID